MNAEKISPIENVIEKTFEPKPHEFGLKKNM